MKNFISVVIPTHNHAWELDKTLYSLSRQVGIGLNEFEVIIVNTNPEDKDTLKSVSNYNKSMKNLRLIQVYDSRAKTIKNACFAGNLGVRQYAKGGIVIMVVDSARVPTPGVLRKTRDEFERWGDEIVTVTFPYHFFKHYSNKSFTVEECREEFLKTRWKQDLYCLFFHAAHTNISLSGIHNEATWLGITKENFLKVKGFTELFTEWSSYNLDLFRRLTRPRPEVGVQQVGIINKWGKVGLGLEIKILEGEADFHLHHSLSESPRSFANLKELRDICWKHYEKVGDCIFVNKDSSGKEIENWGKTEEAEEVKF